MAFINCPECSKKISDRAPTCSHCGTEMSASKTGGPDHASGGSKGPAAHPPGKARQGKARKVSRKSRGDGDERPRGKTLGGVLFILGIAVVFLETVLFRIPVDKGLPLIIGYGMTTALLTYAFMYFPATAVVLIFKRTKQYYYPIKSVLFCIFCFFSLLMAFGRAAPELLSSSPRKNLAISNVQCSGDFPVEYGGELKEGALFYTDREVVLSGIPPQFESLPYIRTACDLKKMGVDTEVSFDIDSKAYIYIAWDSRVPAADWLVADYTKTGMSLSNSAKKARRHIYRSNRPQGPGRVVTFGQKPSNYSFYLIFLEETDSA